MCVSDMDLHSVVAEVLTFSYVSVYLKTEEDEAILDCGEGEKCAVLLFECFVFKMMPYFAVCSVYALALKIAVHPHPSFHLTICFCFIYHTLCWSLIYIHGVITGHDPDSLHCVLGFSPFNHLVKTCGLRTYWFLSTGLKKSRSTAKQTLF